MKCYNCNGDIDENSKFCIHCGSKIEVEEGQENVEENEIIETTVEPEDMENEYKLYKLNKIISISIGSLLLISIIVMTSFYLSKGETILGHGEVTATSLAEEAEEELKEIHILDDIYTIAPDKTQKINFYTLPENNNKEVLKWSTSNPNIKVNQSGFITSSEENQDGVITVTNEKGNISNQTKVKITNKKDSFYESIEYINNQNYTTRDFLDFSLHSFDIGRRLQSEERDIPTDIFGMINKEISGYKLIQKQFINIDTDNPIDCDVYIDIETGDIRKIVTIEYIDDYLEIKDFYFLDGQVYFVFNRNENYYRPVPAQQDFPGERYYFNQDSMVRWRKIEKVGDVFEKTNYDYIENLFSWTTYEYPDITDTDLEKENYKRPDEDAEYRKQKETEFLRTEKIVLDEAYNVYNKVIEAPDTTNISGYVADSNGQPMEGVTVKVFSEQFNLLVGENKTKSDGSYNFLVPLNYSNYRVVISKSEYVNTTIYDVDSDVAASNIFQETVYLYPEGYNIYNVRINFHDALDGNYLSNYSNSAELIVRKGINNRNGAIELHDYVELDYYDYYEIGLYPGTYTAELITPGYESTYFTISTLYDNMEVNSNSIPNITNDDVRIVLTWGANPSDLDSHLFLPNGNNIAYYSKVVDGGNLDIDDTSSYGPETVTIDSLKQGTYKYYVADYSNSSYERYTSTDMSQSNARVDVYDKTGLISTFIVPSYREGVIWHVFNIANGKIVPVQRIFNNVEDHKWWNSSKY